MHRIWIINLEEIIGKSNLNRLLKRHVPRHALLMLPGDLLISTLDFPDDFANYVSKLRENSELSKEVIKIPRPSSADSFIDLVLADTSLITRLKKLSETGKYCLAPFIETPKIAEFSQKTGIPLRRTQVNLVMQGLIYKLNEKTFFKDLSKKLGIDTIPGIITHTKKETGEAIREICKRYNGRAILKKSFSGGGFGNLAGDEEFLISRLDDFYEPGGYVVEKLIDIERTMGSLVVIDESGSKYIGANTQIITNYGWVGCRYPYTHSGDCKIIEELSTKYANEIYKMGGRGLLNIDWCIEKSPLSQGEILGLEINLRKNGLNYVIEAAKNCFNFNENDFHLSYFSEFRINSKIKDFNELIIEALKVKVNGQEALAADTSKKQGFIFTTPLYAQKIGILMAGESREYVDFLEKAVSEKLGEPDES